uniref:NADH-ubiquinone oxidoreductase chain 6 n=1 Tax=Iphisa elegans TaxID=88863 RepID=A0A6M8YKN9_IPHEL|nr:NADH dehydrogenase subunit 6 [Iphisa elegans]QKK36733.1 NADH dehydrogenase subunit 6 [Iphisa elegans]
MYLVSLLLFCVVFSTVGVACHPSPFLGAVGLLLCVLGGCGYLVCLGGSFIGVVLLLVYLGGVLVVYAYSIALAYDKYVEVWGSRSVFGLISSYTFFIVVLWCILGDVYKVHFFSGISDIVGVSLLYSCGGLVLILCGGGLLVALFSALELVRGRVRGGLRMV